MKDKFFRAWPARFKLVLKSIKDEKGGGREKEIRKDVKRKRRIAGKNSERGHSARVEGLGR